MEKPLSLEAPRFSSCCCRCCGGLGEETVARLVGISHVVAAVLLAGVTLSLDGALGLCGAGLSVSIDKVGRSLDWARLF